MNALLLLAALALPAAAVSQNDLEAAVAEPSRLKGLLKDLKKENGKVSAWVLRAAAAAGHTRSLTLLLEAPNEGRADDVSEAAGRSGKVDTIKAALRAFKGAAPAALKGAVQSGSREAATYVFSLKPALSQDDWRGLVYHAVRRGDVPMLQLLQERGADPCDRSSPEQIRRTAVDWAHGTPGLEAVAAHLAPCLSQNDLFHAVQFATASVPALLAHLRPDPFAFRIAAEHGKWQAAELIAPKLAGLCSAAYSSHPSVLAWTIETGNLRARSILLAAGADPTAACGGSSALDAAAEKDDAEAAGALLATGRVGSVDKALVRAARAGSLKVLALLLEKDPQQQALEDAYLAAVLARKAAAVELLLSKGATVEAKFLDGKRLRSALTALVESRQTVDSAWGETAAAVLRRGLRDDPEPLIAAQGPEAVRALLKAGLRPAAPALLVRKFEQAASQGVYSFEETHAAFEELLKGGADPNSAKDDGTTPLLAVGGFVWADHVKPLIKMLLAYGADPTQTDVEGRTPQQLALRQGQKEAANLLRAGAARPRPAAAVAAAARPPDLRKLVEEAVQKEVAAKQPAAAAKPRAVSSDVDKPAYQAPEDPDAFAVVVGVESYSELPKATYAERDAQAVKRHLLASGFPERNVILLTGQRAVRSSLKKYLETWLPRNVGEKSRVFFYFSGHGSPDPSTGAAYLVPWDGDPSFLDDTAYPVKTLYETLGRLKAREVVVALDACFSGAGGRSVLPAGARPLVAKAKAEAPSGKLVVFAAAQSDQITNVLDDQGHGIFTYYFLKGLNDGAVEPSALYQYLKPRVQDAARRQNREQTPALIGSASVRLR